MPTTYRVLLNENVVQQFETASPEEAAKRLYETVGCGLAVLQSQQGTARIKLMSISVSAMDEC